MQRSNVGILGIGVHLPEHLRTNGWWPPAVVAAWQEQRARTPAPPSPRTEGMARVLAAMAQTRDDPFQGAVERRVMAEGAVACDMEQLAAEEALSRAGVDRSSIDLLLCHTTVPEQLLTNTACELHHRLGLPTDCFTMVTEGAAASFVMQFMIAEQMIAGGRARNALLVQSCSVTRLLDPSDPLSPLFGDAASAVVVGPVAEGRGILGARQCTDGRASRTLVASVRGGRWYDEGRVILHSADPMGARDVFLLAADRGKEVSDAALREARMSPSDVDFFVVHTGTPWFRQVMQEHFGLTSARSIESFSSTAYVFSVSIPLGLSLGEREGLLRSDDVVLLHGGGTGVTYGSLVLRWGR
ncbi:MAG: 3-oxoacyl-ACP synthase III family protein [Labilithrix sp.]|nr:3-oxoacyl-ACP synthase III family protein [Labilithrix sp.]